MKRDFIHQFFYLSNLMNKIQQIIIFISISHILFCFIQSSPRSIFMQFPFLLFFYLFYLFHFSIRGKVEIRDSKIGAIFAACDFFERSKYIAIMCKSAGCILYFNWNNKIASCIITLFSIVGTLFMVSFLMY